MAENQTAAATTAAVKPPLGELRTIAGVFIDPRPSFEDISARPRWIVPVAITVLFALAFTYLMSTHIGWAQIVRQGMESSQQTQNMTPEQREQAVSMGAKFAGIIAYVAAVAGVPIAYLVIAGVLLGMFNGLLGARLVFKQVFAVVAYANLPKLIETIEAAIVMMLKSPEDFNPQHMTGFDVGYYLPETTAKWLAAVASSIDLFSIWIILLTAAGLRVASRKLSFGKALAGVLLPWAVWVLLKVGWAAIRG